MVLLCTPGFFVTRNAFKILCSVLKCFIFFPDFSVSGCTDYYAQSEEEAFEMCRDIVEGFNLNRLEPNTFSKPAYEIPSMNRIN